MIRFFRKLNTNKEKIWSFPGGIRPLEMKKQSNQVPLLTLPLADKLIIPIQQHIGASNNLIVKTGDYVLKGQALTKSNEDNKVPIHATTSGIITAIVSHISLCHHSSLKTLCIWLQPDNKDHWCERKPLINYLEHSTEVLLSRIKQAGIVGLGGAAFPTAIKLKNGIKLINTLIINAAECEPYITADDLLIQEHANEIIEGILILIHILKPKEVLIGIEDNKPAAIRALEKALINKQQAIIKLRVIPTKYPSGSAKQLIKILTGKEVPHGVHSSFIGLLVQNVSTVFAIKRAVIDGEPLIERVITLTGGAIQNPGNYWVRLGTPVNFLLQQVGIISKSEQIVIMGGPLMGSTLLDLSVPIVKTSNCVLAPTSKEISRHVTEKACIRCGFCSQVCPVNLLPQQLYWFSKGQEHEKAEKYHLFDCIECGACAYICPSKIPLVQYYQQEKITIRNIAQEKQRALDAKKRFEAKKIRLEHEKLFYKKWYKHITIESSHVKNSKLSATQNEKAKTEEHAILNIKAATTEGHLTNNLRKSVIAAAIARAKAKRNVKKSAQ